MSQTTHPDPASSRHDAPVSAGLTIGFAISACLWTLGYLLHFPGLSTPPIVVGLLLLVVQAVGSALAGMWGPSRAKLRLGLTTGLTMGLVNLLVLGSLLFESSGETTQARPAAGVIVLGWLAYSLVLGVVGVWIGGAVSPGGGGRDQSAPAWRARFGVLAALTMLPLLFVGGVVTTSDSGMAVPDWPNTFGSNMFLFPLSKMTGGVYFEHTHRLFGVLEGLTVLTLMALTIRGGGALAKKLAVIAFVL
ncbi:MAG: hypothetical protein KDA21_15555, partial [Phycisphaerales bacterium]|nr:hypothetical protein [Phycisphaerales bacterium]